MSSNLLAALKTLSNDDKHRACNFTLASGRDLRFVVYANDGVVVELRFNEPVYLGEAQTLLLPLRPEQITPSARVQTLGWLP